MDLSKADAFYSRESARDNIALTDHTMPFICKQYTHWSPQFELMLVCAGGTLLHKLKRLDEAVRSVFQPAHRCRMALHCAG